MGNNTVAEIAQMEDKMIVGKFTGKIGFVGKAEKKSFPGKEGGMIEEHVQGIAVSDDTGSLWVEIKDHPAIPMTAKGQEVTFEAFYSEDRKQWYGLTKSSYTKINKETGKEETKIKLTLTKTGKMTLGQKSVEPEKKSDDNTSKEKSAPSQKSETPKSEKVDWDGKEKRTYKGMCVSYAKDLACDGRINAMDIIAFAEAFFEYIYGDKAKAEEMLVKIKIADVFKPAKED